MLRAGARSDGPPKESRLDLLIGGVPATVRSHHQPGIAGMRHYISVGTERGLLELAGGFRMGGPWSYGPVRLDGRALTEGECTPPDPWELANHLSIGTAVAVIRGDLHEAAAAQAGLFTAGLAVGIDRCAQDAFGSPRHGTRLRPECRLRLSR